MAKPTPRQLAYLAKLAQRCGETFAVPTTRREASAEIERLKGRRPTSRSNRRRERREVGRDMAQRSHGAAVREAEITGYGSSAHWR